MWSLIVAITQACILHTQTEDFLNKVNIYSTVGDAQISVEATL